MLIPKLETSFQSFEAKFRYIVDTFNSVYHLKETVTIGYGEASGQNIQVMPGTAPEFFKSNNVEPEKVTWFTRSEIRLPGLFDTSPIEEIISKDPNDGSVHIFSDIIGSSFYFLSCWQEYRSNKKDKYGRFPMKDSTLYQLGIMHLPVVNYYFEIIAEAVGLFTGKRPEINYSEKAPFHVSLTHDIDQCLTGWRQDGLRQFLAGERFRAVGKMWKGIIGDDIWFNFDQILQIEQELGVAATYNFITTNKKIDGLPNADYNINSKRISDVIKKIIINGNSIGIHGSVGTHISHKKLTSEINCFPHKVIGGRFHYLMLKIQESFDIIEKAGLQYDSSLGYAECIGFRNGYCYGFAPYNFREERAYHFREFPLMVMDKTLIKPYYMGLSPDEAFNKVMSLIKEIRKFNGHLILLWHNSVMSGFKYRDWVNFYESIIKECLKMNANIKPLEWYLNKDSEI
ncbi:polysaccharide deacetylase family protein [candidate division KSB1 bacterium]|nr:polysaccharide deacetylase family protein [candidate division KSB1 bacterium]